MDLITTKNLVFPLTLMKFAGIHPKQKGPIPALLNIFGFVLSITVYALAFIDYFMTENTVTQFAKKFETQMTISQILMKGFILIYYKKALSEILDITQNFKDINSADLLIQAKFKKYLDDTLKKSKFYLSAVSFSLLFFIGKPFFPGHELPLWCFVPDKFLLTYNLIFFMEIILVFYIIFTVIAHDIFFFNLCTKIVLQFRLLSYLLRNLDMSKFVLDRGNETFLELKNCIVYHEHLIK